MPSLFCYLKLIRIIMADLSTYTKNKIFDLLFNNTTFTAVANLYIGLFTVAPTDAGGGTEVSDIAPRIALSMGAPTDGAGSNDGELLWAAAVSGYTAVAVGVFDASSAGNLLAWKSLGSEVVGVGVKFRYPIGDFDADVQ